MIVIAWMNIQIQIQTSVYFTSLHTKVATQDINFGILIKIPQKVELDLP